MNSEEGRMVESGSPRDFYDAMPAISCIAEALERGIC